jgi:adenylate cyclase
MAREWKAAAIGEARARRHVVAGLLGPDGDPTRAIAHYEEALTLAEEIGEPQLLFPCYDGLATVHLDLGDDGLAEEFMQKAQAVCERAGLEPEALVVLPFLD